MNSFLDMIQTLQEELNQNSLDTKEKTDLAVCEFRNNLLNRNATVPFELMERILAHLNRRDDEALNMLYREACKNHIEKITLPEVIETYFNAYPPSTDSVEIAINGLLTRASPQPIAISFCSKAISEGRSYQGMLFSVPMEDGIISRSMLSFINDHNRCGPHAAVILGQRWNPASSKCEYLVRNTWSWNCVDYRKKGFACEDSTREIWVESDLMARSILFLTTFK